MTVFLVNLSQFPVLRLVLMDKFTKKGPLKNDRSLQFVLANVS